MTLKISRTIMHETKIYKKVYGLLLLCIIQASMLSYAYPQNSPSNYQKGFLWKVQSKSSEVYILGSIHALKKDIYPLPEKIEGAFNRSDALVVEANINEMSPEKMMTMLESALYAGDDTLEKHISKETYELTKAELSESRIPIELFQKSKPWFIASMITALELNKIGFNPEYGIDVHFLKEAEGRKRILELESIGFQIDLFNSFSNTDQEMFLLYTLKDLSILKQEVGVLMKAWSAGDIKTLESILLKGLQEDSRLLPIYEKLIYERNRNMTSKIEVFLKTGERYFVVIGAGHLVGKGGILELLKERGYFVEQL